MKILIGILHILCLSSSDRSYNDAAQKSSGYRIIWRWRHSGRYGRNMAAYVVSTKVAAGADGRLMVLSILQVVIR